MSRCSWPIFLVFAKEPLFSCWLQLKKLGPKLAYWFQSSDPSWSSPCLAYFDSTKSVSILSFHRKNQLFEKCLRYLQRAIIDGHLLRNYNRVRSQSLEVLVFCVVKGLNLDEKVANQFYFCGKSSECVLSKHCSQRIDLYLGLPNENHAKMSPLESFFQSVMKSNLFVKILEEDAVIRSKLYVSKHSMIFELM